MKLNLSTKEVQLLAVALKERAKRIEEGARRLPLGTQDTRARYREFRAAEKDYMRAGELLQLVGREKNG